MPRVANFVEIGVRESVEFVLFRNDFDLTTMDIIDIEIGLKIRIAPGHGHQGFASIIVRNRRPIRFDPATLSGFGKFGRNPRMPVQDRSAGIARQSFNRTHPHIPQT